MKGWFIFLVACCLLVIAHGLVGCAHPAGEAGSRSSVLTQERPLAPYEYRCGVEDFDDCNADALSAMRAPRYSEYEGPAVKEHAAEAFRSTGLNRAWFRRLQQVVGERSGGLVVLELVSPEASKIKLDGSGAFLRLTRVDGQTMLLHFSASREGFVVVEPAEPKRLVQGEKGKKGGGS